MSFSSIGRHLFAVFSLLVFSRAVVFQLFQPVTERGDTALAGGADVAPVITQPEMFWIYVTIYLVTGVLLLPRWRQVISLLVREWFIASLLLLALISALWSVNPAETLAKSVALGACTLFGMHLALEYSPEQQAKLLASAFALLILGSFTVGFLFPDFGIMGSYHSGLWQGVFPHKNMLGKLMCLGAIAFFVLAARSRGAWFYWVGFVASLVLMQLSSSKSALLSFSIVFLALCAYVYLRGQRKLATVALLSTLIAGGSILIQKQYKVYPSILLHQGISLVTCGVPSCWPPRLPGGVPFSADMNTVAGRMELWQGSWGKIRQRPWLGYGFGAFWRDDNEEVQDIWSRHADWKPMSSHNGFLDLWLELGATGLFLYLVSVCRSLFRCFQWLCPVKPFDSLDLFYPVVLVGVCLINVAQSGLVEANFSPWILVVMVTFSILKNSRDCSENKRYQTDNVASNVPLNEH